MPAIAGPLVAAAGNVAGGAAASALMGDTSYPKGGGIDGLTSADTGKSGTPSAVQIDPTTALKYFESAGNSYETKAMSGLSYYDTAIKGAGAALTAGVAAANNTLKPLSQAGQEATNQYMRMLGLDAMSPTGDIAGQISGLGYGQLSEQIAAAEKIKDPTQRQAAKDNIMAGFQNALGNQGAANEQARQAALAGLAPAMDWSTALTTSQNAFNGATAKYNRDGSAQADLNNQLGGSMFTSNSSGLLKSLSKPLQDQYNAQLKQGDYAAAQATLLMGKSQQDYQKQVDAVNAQYGTDSKASSLTSIMNQYSNNYSQNQDYLGYTGQEVTDQIRSTPGYQFQMDQGLEGINRAAAAGGMLSSGNTLLAANNYAQNQADSYYQSYMSNLNNVMGMGNSATGQISSNQANLGSGLASLSQSLGQAGLTTYGNIGQALYNAYTNMGQTWNQDMLANMAAQNAMISQSSAQNTQVALANQQNGISQGYLNLNAASTANSINNQQQQAVAFNNAMKSSTNKWVLG